MGRIWKWSWPSQGALTLHVVTVENHQNPLLTADVLAKALTWHHLNTHLGISIKSVHSVLDFDSFTHLPHSQLISLKSLLILILHFFLTFQVAAFQQRFPMKIVIHFCIYVCHKYEVMFKYVFAF
jgi:hypothetical protein